jgi:hypothetical protein
LAHAALWLVTLCRWLGSNFSLFYCMWYISYCYTKETQSWKSQGNSTSSVLTANPESSWFSNQGCCVPQQLGCSRFSLQSRRCCLLCVCDANIFKW